jgi:hypothetical protein
MCPQVSHKGASPIIDPSAAWTDAAWVSAPLAFVDEVTGI